LITGASKVNVVDISDTGNPKLVFHTYLGAFDPTDVEFCGDHVFVALDNNQNREAGRVVVFKKYDKKANTLEAVLNITGMPVLSFFLLSNLKFNLVIFGLFPLKAFAETYRCKISVSYHATSQLQPASVQILLGPMRLCEKV
jgi:hypothetical protein